jgi:sec-independent protein translocase protein TatB
MGGLGPGIGGLEILVIGLLALIVVGPKDLPLLMRKVGRAVGKARAMANEFRSSFDEMARQSELDELRKEVEALRTGQGMVPLGAEAEATFRDISEDLNRPLDGAATQPALTAPDEWPDSSTVMEPLEASAEVEPKPKPKPKPKAKPKGAAGTKASTARTAPARTASIKTASGKSRPIRAKKVDL